jgi:Tfp pilus assembly protein PilW
MTEKPYEESGVSLIEWVGLLVCSLLIIGVVIMYVVTYQ